MVTTLELIEVERERVQELRTRFTIAKAFQDELDERAGGHVLEFANTTIRQMVSDHRYGLVARVAGWIRTATERDGLIDQLAAGDHVSAFRAMSEDDEEDRPAIGATDPFTRRFPRVPSGATPVPADLEPIRQQLLGGAANVAELDADLNSVVTDLAGVRVIVYDDDEAEQVTKLIKDTWREYRDEPINRRYKARHLTVVVADGESHAINGARCEIQLTSLAAHAFNELEHDIGYKHHGVPPGGQVQEKLDMLEKNTEALQAAIRDLLTARKVELIAAKVEIATGSDLGVVLDDVIRARATGDVDALFYVWQGVEPRLTRALVTQQAPLLLRDGRALSGPNVDDATAIATALSVTLQSEVRDIAREYPNQDSALIRAILDASLPENA